MTPHICPFGLINRDEWLTIAALATICVMAAMAYVATLFIVALRLIELGLA